INVAMTDNFQINVSIQHDSVFDLTTFVNFSWRLPDGIPTKWFKPQSVCERLNSMVIRQDRIPMLDETTGSTAALLNPPRPPSPGNPLNPNAGQPIFVGHVDPNLGAGVGNGTAQSPY